MQGYKRLRLGFNYHRFINLCRVSAFKAITGDESPPIIAVQIQMTNNDELSKPMVEQAVVSLVPLKLL
jgi:hypothetical protein